MRARYENNVLKPLEKLDLKEGEEVDIELKGKSLVGLLKGWKIDSQSLKGELREINSYNPLPYGGITDIHGNIIKAITKEEHDEMLARVRRAFQRKK